VLIIINTSVLWISTANIVFVIRVKSIVSPLVDLGEGLGILLLLAHGWWWGWGELSRLGVDVSVIIHRGGTGVVIETIFSVKLGKSVGILLLLACGWNWRWSELSSVGVDVSIIIHRCGT
jgi:hypothetical protein